MSWELMLGLGGAVMVGLLALGVWVPVTLALAGITILSLGGYFGRFDAIGTIYWTQGGSFVLLAIPLFILMGEIILASGISSRFYRAVTPWVQFLPGKLFNSNIVASALFAAISGSSVATTAAIGTVAVPELRQRNYNDRITYGTIAAGGTLGILIPPSATLIIYGSMVNESIAKLFIAAIIPGLLITALFLVYVMVASLLRPGVAPRTGETISFSILMKTLPDMLPLVLLIGIVMGCIYTGVVTPTEAAALGVLGALLICAFTGGLRLTSLAIAVRRSVVSTSMILFIVLGAQILSYSLARTNISRDLVDLILNLGWGPWEIFVILCIMYLILGCFMDAISIMVLTLPLVHPVIVALGFDPLWFGIVLVILIETGLITPPVGLNLFVMQNVVGNKDAFRNIVIGCIPFVVMMLLAIVILSVWPQLVLWLPTT